MADNIVFIPFLCIFCLVILDLSPSSSSNSSANAFNYFFFLIFHHFLFSLPSFPLLSHLLSFSLSSRSSSSSPPRLALPSCSSRHLFFPGSFTSVMDEISRYCDRVKQFLFFFSCVHLTLFSSLVLFCNFCLAFLHSFHRQSIIHPSPGIYRVFLRFFSWLPLFHKFVCVSLYHTPPSSWYFCSSYLFRHCFQPLFTAAFYIRLLLLLPIFLLNLLYAYCWSV